jgi:RimJ/RimL family protein N-acetyltransferase
MSRIIETERLLMRPHEGGDFADCLALWTDPTVTRFVGGRPSTREEVWARILRYIGHWSVLGYGYWAICEKTSGRVVGEAGFGDLKRELSPSFGDAPEAGWVLAPSTHGKGLATEAMRAAIAWLEAARGRERTVCMIDPANAPSRRVAEKLGYREYTRAPYKDHTTVLFERVPLT